MIELDVDKGSISFKDPISLDQFSKAMHHFNKMYKILFSKDAMYKDFTDFLVTCDGVEVTPGLAEKKK